VDDTRLPLTAHLTELRDRIVKVLLAWAVGAVLAYAFAEQIFGFVLHPAIVSLSERGSRLQAIAPTEIFFTYLKSALLAGFVCTLPLIFWQVWSFVSPGLYPGEKKVALPFVLISTVLFLLGATFGHQIMFPVMFDFLANMQNVYVESAWTMREVFSLTTRLFLALGIAFELPVAMFFLSLSGIVTARQLFSGLPYAAVGGFILGAMLSPPDVVSQIFLAVPLVALYLVGVGVAYLVGRRRARRDVADDAARI
jgi:sec-independent protein translocase protein TatC